MDCPNVPAIVVPPSTRVVRKVVALMATLAMLLVAVFPTPGAAIPPPNTQYPDTFDNKFQPTHRLRRLAVIPTPQASHRLSRRELFHSADKDGNSPGQAPTNTPGQLTARFVVRDPRRSLHDFEDHSNPYHEAEAFTSVEVRSFPFVNSLASPLSARRVKHERRNPASTAIRQRYGDRIDISLPLDEGSLCDLQLEIDKDLIAPGFVLKAEGPNGEMVDMTDKFEHIYYRGSAKHPVLGQGSARVAIHHLDSATGTAVLEGLVDFSHAPEGSAFARRSVVHSADRSGDRLFRIQRRLTFERAALSQLPTEDYIPSSAARSSRNIPSEGDAFLSTQPEPMDGAFFRIRRKAVRTRSSAAAAAATATAEPTEQHVDEESFPAEADDTLIVSDDVSMVVFRQSDVELIPGGPVPTCGNDHHHEHASALLETPSAEEDGFMPDVQAAAQHVSHLTHNPYSLEEVRAMAPFAGCPLTPKVLYMGFASDCTYSTFRGGDVRDISEYILNNVQMANNVYEPLFHTSLGVIELSIRLSCSDQPSWNRGCMDKYDIAERLSDFSHWRGGLSSDKPETGTEAGLWHLMSRCASGNTVGIAWVNMLCQVRSFAQSSSYVSGTAVSTPTSEEWLIVAHEIGHNFGANHDCMNSDCPKGDKCCRCSEASDGCNCAQQYIMNPLSSSSQSSFSECSQRVICSRMASDRSSCLADPGGRELLNRNMCGNGIWELPEECDCGGETGCMDHPCCNSDCTLKPGANCSDGNTACCQNCQIVQDPTHVCRPKAGECDVPETCRPEQYGAMCPPDLFVEDGTLCEESEIEGAYCASGMCTTRDAQCIAAGNTGTILDVSSYRGACPQALASCRMTCLLPYDTTCKFLGTGFRNGTRCGSDGFCYGGSCSEASFLQWVEGNLILFCVLAGIAALLVLIFLVWGCRQAGRKQLRPLSIGIPGRTGGGKKGAKNQASSGKKQSQKNSKPSATKGGASTVSLPPGTSGQGTIRCPLCPLSFPGESHLTLHLDRDHS